MIRESEEYRFARIEGYRITLTRLEQQFKDRAVNLEKMEAAVIEHLQRRISVCLGGDPKSSAQVAARVYGSLHMHSYRSTGRQFEVSD